MTQTAIKIADITPDQKMLLRLLSPEERRDILLRAALERARQLQQQEESTQESAYEREA